MPTISVFIRKDDLDKFKALPNKSEFLHDALNQDEGYSLQDFKDKKPQADMKALSGISDTSVSTIKTKEDVIPAINRVFPDAKFEPLYRDKKNKKL